MASKVAITLDSSGAIFLKLQVPAHLLHLIVKEGNAFIMDDIIFKTESGDAPYQRVVHIAGNLCKFTISYEADLGFPFGFDPLTESKENFRLAICLLWFI